jgi:capsid portal protein
MRSGSPVQVVPLGNIESKDSYEAIQGITERQALAMHRTPPILVGIIPADGSSFGNVKEMKDYYHEFEVESMQKTFLALNDSEGEELVKFETPSWRLTQIA